MSFAPTFGSIGDFIAISILIKDAVTALNDAKGSASEYHQLIGELLSLERAFLEVGMLCQTPDPSPELVAISIQIRRITDQCKSSLENFLLPIYEYTGSFRRGGSGNKFHDAFRKIKWRFEKDKIIRFHNEITTHGMAIGILLHAANTRLLRLNHNTLQEHTLQIQGANQALSHRQIQTLEEVKAMHNEYKDQLALNQTNLGRISDKIDRLQTTGLDIRPLFSMLILVIIQGFQTLLKAHSGVPREFEPCFTQKPVIFTDAHGRVHRIHLEWCNSWDSFETTLLSHFSNVPGRRKILEKEYACQERFSKLELHRDRPYEESFLPGRVIDMSMTFVREGVNSVCPVCQLEIDQPMDTEIHCPLCHTNFQRVQELIENPPIYIDSGTSTTPNLEFMGTPQTERLGVEIASGNREIRDKQKNVRASTTNENSVEDDPRHYTMIRLRQLIPSSRRSVGIQCDDLPYDDYPYFSEDDPSALHLYEEG